MFRYRKARLAILALVLLVSSMGFTAGERNEAHASAAPVQDAPISDFESGDDGWSLSLGPEFPGAEGSLERVNADAGSGSFSGRLAGSFSGGGAYVAMNKALDALAMRQLELMVKTADLSAIRLRVTDATGQVHQQTLALQADAGWQKLTVSAFDAGVNYSHWGGANDGAYHAPATEVTFLMERSELVQGKNSAELLLDDIVAKVDLPLLSIEQTALGNVFEGTDTAAFRIVTQGDAVTWKIDDLWGNPVRQGTEAIAGGTGELNVPNLQQGYYRMTMTAEKAGAQLASAETSFALLAPLDPGQAAADSPFGVATHFGQWWNPELIPLIRMAGAGSIRDELYWGNVEPERGVYRFPGTYDRYMSELQRNGLDPFIIFSYANALYDEGSTPYSDEGRQGFAQYGKSILQHYGDQVKWVEVYNEFNIGFGDTGNGPADSKPDYYYKLLKETYQTVKAEDSNVVVVGAATAGTPWDWLEEVFRLGGLEVMDAVSIHPYRYPDTPEGLVQDLTRLQSLIRQYNNGQPKPIWITEMGWPTQRDFRGVSEETQASYVVRSHVAALSQGVEKFFWYDFMNDGTNEMYNEHNFGIIRHPADAKGKYTPKPAYAAYAAMTRQLTGLSYTRAEQIGEGISSHLFKGNGQEVRVLWAAEPTDLTLKTNRSITVTDVVGNKKTYYPDKSNVIYLTVGQDPIYVGGNVKSFELGSKYTLSGSEAFVGEPIPLAFAVDNTVPPRAPIAASLAVNGQSYDLTARPGEREETAIPLSGADAAGMKTVSGDIIVDGKPVGRLTTEVRIIHPVQLQVKHVLRGETDALQVQLDNRSSQPYVLDRIEWQIGNQSGEQTGGLTVPAASTGRMELALPSLPAGELHSMKLALEAEGFPSATFEGRLKLVGNGGYTPLAAKTVTVDGTPDDLSTVPGVDLSVDGTVQTVQGGFNGAEDLSGQVWVTWDQEHLYLSASIHDDVFSQTATDAGIWNGDSIQFAVSQGTPGENIEMHEFGVALTNEGPQVYRWMGANGQPAGLVRSAQAAVTRDEANKNTYYELALPWEELAPVEAEDGLFSLSYLVNDNDGQGRKGWIEWASGIGFGKNPAEFKPVRLMLE
ncbi:sugar-binding protein [Paenibacillus spongiae]|uniref:Glycosyl hydrolase n=1 Tax=Paenibacillus spongiae TaxID=2909671 RepID=A0ABY5SAD0_9BACL|nr:sugar-binding protein [Paenibacillus spongiae]UVI29740.1 glycosyl hydrolase [Paenibacillus spongiae]